MDYEKQIKDDADEIINGKGYVVIPNLFSKEEIKEAKDLIDQNMEKLLKEAGRDSAVQGEYDDKKSWCEFSSRQNNTLEPYIQRKNF